MTEDDLGSARGYLAARLEELWQAAGAPPLDMVARNARSVRSSSTNLTGKKISAWKTGTNVPHAFTELENVIRLLIQRARPAATHDVTSGLYDERQWEKWWTAARKSSAGPSRDSQPSPLGQPIDDKLDPFDLEVHRAIYHHSNESISALPAYIEREHDQRLREIVDQAKMHNALVVLVGGSSTGKTRACWEAVQRLAGWRLWHPLSPGRPEALLYALDRGLILPRTVLWLNEMQHYLNTPASSIGERVAAGLRELIRNTNDAPILVLGTLWPEYWGMLTRWPAPLEHDVHPQSRELLTGREIIIPDSFKEVDVTDLPHLSEADQRIVQAINRPDRRVTQFLAGAFELLSRYSMAPPSARALIDTAIDARRFGFSEALPEQLLRDAAPEYMSDYAWNELGDDWFETATEYVRQPCLGVSGPLVLLRPRSSALSPKEPLYHLADFLEEHGRQSRRYSMPPESFWSAITKRVDSAETLIDLAYEVHYRGRYRLAARIYLMAAAAGNIDGFLFPADHRRLVGDNLNAEKLYKMAIEHGSSLAHIKLAELREESNEKEVAKQMLKDLLRDQATDSEYRSFAWENLVRVCKDTGDVEHIRPWLQRAAQGGDSSAKTELARLNGEKDDSEVSKEMSELKKHAQALLRSHRRMEAAKKRLIKLSFADAESFAWLLQYLKESAIEEEAEGKHSHDLVMLGRLHGVHGNVDSAKTIFLKAINILDDDSYIEGMIPALTEFVNILRLSGDTDTADLAWKYGLEPDESVAAPWDVTDQAP
jgi:hypothetical protein